MNILSSYNLSLRALSLSLMALLLTLATPPAEAQTVGEIHIGGKVYGGGKNGAILTSNDNSDPANIVTDSEDPDFGKVRAKDVVLVNTDFTLDAAQASQVTINKISEVDSDVQITAVFGGGEMGRAYGKTNVTIMGGSIGLTDTDAIAALPANSKSVNGNAFGAGDGAGADVFGGTHVLITDGTINGSVYGGGNQADLIGSTELTLQGGKYVGAVFGGAKQADIFGRTFVNIDGEHAQNHLHIIDVYGGNDIAGTIAPADDTTYPNWAWAHPAALSTTPFTLAEASHLTTGKKPSQVVDGTWNAFVLSTESTNGKMILIDNLYGGGNGDYDYTSAQIDTGEKDADENPIMAPNPYRGLAKPELGKTYMQLQAGMYGSVYGGGNAATVFGSTDICLVNKTNLATYVGTPANLDNINNPKVILDAKSLARYTADYQFNRVFGGNNKEPMAIRPNWYLEQASINNLYSGGNAGPMTYSKKNSAGTNMDAGILIHVESSEMTVNNVYGGCRMADVNPGMLDGSNSISLNAETIDGYNFPLGYSTRVLIEGGNINNVYGGNDVSGVVYYGSNVVIKSSINGDVYGAGNGSYPYTDQLSWVADHPEDADYYYNGGTGGAASADSLNVHRPNAAKSLVQLFGESEGNPTFIGGAVYCGGNSATLRAIAAPGETEAQALAKATSQLIIGSYVVADSVFMGSNGVNMISRNMLAKYADPTFSSLELTQKEQFEKYMKGVEVAIRPTVSFEKNGELGATRDYQGYSTKFGSFYCGGNVGSMSADGKFTIDFLKSLVIYDKLVGGCNSANVDVVHADPDDDSSAALNAYHMGGLIGEPGEGNVKVELNIEGLKLEPRKLTLDPEHLTYSLDWNIYDIPSEENPGDYDKMLRGANIYGGCYASGYINGGVHINISKNAISENIFNDADLATAGITYEAIRNEVLASTLSAYGGGYGPETEIWGDVVVDITGDGQIMKAYGGGEQGVVGKLQRNATTGAYDTQTVQEWYSEVVKDVIAGYDTDELIYKSRDHSVAAFSTPYSTTVNLNANLLTGATPDKTHNVAKLYGGGYQGTVSGHTIVNLNRGRVYDAFGGASNADILEYTQMFVGKASAPTVTHSVYGANDFGGLIVGDHHYTVDNTDNQMKGILAQSYVEYSSGNIANDLFGGACGSYLYAKAKYAEAMPLYNTPAEYNTAHGTSLTQAQFDDLTESARTKPGHCMPQLLRNMLTDPRMRQPGSGVGYAANSFVNIISQSTLSSDSINRIFGAGQGKAGYINLADQRGSYVRLAAAKTSQRTIKQLATRVYGAGFCSNTERSLVDAYSGHFLTLLGGSHGISYQELDLMGGFAETGHYHTNYMGAIATVRLKGMENSLMDIFGGGANAGAQEAGVVLHSGQARDVYGASLDQGITYAASVEVPSSSTAKVNAIFGGAKGASDVYPCDVFNTFVTFEGVDARVNSAIYGGNNAFRMTRNAYMRINVPVKNENGQFIDVFGGGYGPKTVTLYTNIGLEAGAEVANVYGGGNKGQVLDTPSFRYYLDDGKKACLDGTTKSTDLKRYPGGKENDASIYGYQKYLLDNEVIGLHSWIINKHWDNTTYDRNPTPQPIGSYTPNAYGHAVKLYFLSTQMEGMKNTNIYIEGNSTKTAIVHENAYGGGYGGDALVSGETSIKLHGGLVMGDIYGGGYGGHVEEYPHLIYPAVDRKEQTLSATNVYLGGGSARNVYGGGLNGHVVGKTYVTLGAQDEQPYNFYGLQEGQYGAAVCKGDPTVERSLYGGGEKGYVKGTTYLTINQGHIGYKYDPTVTIETTTNAALKAEYNNSGTTSARKAEILKQICYVENLDLNDPGDNFLDQNGNAFGAGYGEGAYVDVTYVNLYGGTIRNSLYGGGEIASVGEATLTEGKFIKGTNTITEAGRTHIYMYKGLVRGDVFGGGRGFSYDLTGNEVVGKTILTDGYVFGTTEVEIRGGEVGTEETLLDGHGNVFGGGNIGYCYTDATQKGERGDGGGEGRYYTNEWKCTGTDTYAGCGHIERSLLKPSVCGKCEHYLSATDPLFRTDFTKQNEDATQPLSEDCRVIVTPYAQVKAENTGTYTDSEGVEHPYAIEIDGIKYAKGDYVPTDELDKLKNKSADGARWAMIDESGVIVRNAVFAGGNVSSGSDKVYANAITVFGNATATVKDIFFRDLITLGTEHVGGLYGDGNLTFVDGYRELNITNYGTDYYNQTDNITIDEYRALNDRERAYFELQYQAKSGHDYYYYSCNAAYDDDTVSPAVHYNKGQHITQDAYSALTDPNKANHWTSGHASYTDTSKMSESQYALLTDAEKGNWDLWGFCSIYAGRLLNTIQRADFCGVFGSRLVLEGAQDRVPEVVDYTQYTINRVGELSLNAKTIDEEKHGNYFGMYNVVNYLGALTSDVDFDDVRVTDNTNPGYKDKADGKEYGVATYYDWKVANKGGRKRNNGTSHNVVALASGVYLEIVEEPTSSSVPGQKDWGLITGIVELDLINVMPGLGGGYVYAKNVHGTRRPASGTGIHENLSKYNHSAVNNTKYTYDEEPASNREYIETSGNFIHNTKQIVDDCYPGGGQYMDYSHETGSPAHYWYIRGEIYVYDQYISAFTGSSTAYTENINLPLTITAGANGRLDLLDIKPNLYAYYNQDGAKLGSEELTVVNNITYGLNDVITYWEWMQLNETQQQQFVPKTYVATMDYCLDTTGLNTTTGEVDEATIIKAGDVILPDNDDPKDLGYKQLKGISVFDPETVSETDGVYSMGETTLGKVFHVSNAVEHDNGYVLTVDLSNPVVWDKWYVQETSANKISTGAYDALTDEQKKSWHSGPNFYPTVAGVYGQRKYEKDDIITLSVKKAYDQIDSAELAATGNTQAEVNRAYVAVAAAEYSYGGKQKNVQAGVGISETEYLALTGDVQAKFARALTCTSTYEENPAEGQYIYYGELIPETKYNELIQTLTTGTNPRYATEEAAKGYLSQYFDDAYIITTEGGGWYGGQHFAEGTNYPAINTWATLSSDDREKFAYRYDALDALGLATYPGTGLEGDMTDYDGPYWDGTGMGAGGNGWPLNQVYGAKQPIDYTAVYTGTDINENGVVLTNGQEYSRTEYESLPNEQRHYSHFEVTDSYVVKQDFSIGSTTYTVGTTIPKSLYDNLEAANKSKVQSELPNTIYIVKESFINGGSNYAAGKIITDAEYASLKDKHDAKIVAFHPTTTGEYYICREAYTIDNGATGHAVTTVDGDNIAKGSNVAAGTIITPASYATLCNYQINRDLGISFSILGNSPIETSTFYVNRESDIYDLSKERVITVVYQYKYEESDESGNNIEEIVERHVVNIHIEFKSGVPTIGKLQEPAIVLPGQTVGLKLPNVVPGAYELLGGGWELFTNPGDAEKHQNGKPYINNDTKMYWYQNDYYVAYYAKTYLGKTYSNAVPFKVANYHDIAEVMADTKNYMFIDHPDVDRNSKIYIDNSWTDEHPDATKSEIDMLYDLFQKSLVTSKKTIEVDVHDIQQSGGKDLYWVVNDEGNRTGETTTTPDTNDEPVYLYYEDEDAANAKDSERTTTDRTAFAVTHKEDREVPTFDDHARNCANLDFYLNDDVASIKEEGWTPIGWDNSPTDHQCFMGTLHGMGHTISGLSESLFGELCGYVYNLGVTGSFTKSGVADRVATATVPDSKPEKQIHGYVNSSWIYTSADPFDVGASNNPANRYYPVVGEPNVIDPSAPDPMAGMHVHNCYFPEGIGYDISDQKRINPYLVASEAKLYEFNNGEVAYNLNGFYLNKRYSDAVITQSDISSKVENGILVGNGDDVVYKFWKQNSSGELIKTPTTDVPETPVKGYYKGGGSMHAYKGMNLGYVERLFADGDFVYRNGTIPTVQNERYSISESRYLPIWPDDYYFFGQQLTYGYDEAERPYQPLPSAARKTLPSKDGSGQDRRLVQTKLNNIIYRVPAYYRSHEKDVAHFNPEATFAASIKSDYHAPAHLGDAVLGTKDIHTGLTALDFSGFNDRAVMVGAGTDGQKFESVPNTVAFSSGYRQNVSTKAGYDAAKHSILEDQVYFGPITDYTILSGIRTYDITQNLLAYAPTATWSEGTKSTQATLAGYFNEPSYADHHVSDDPYRRVEAINPSDVSNIHGHLVMKENKASDRHYYYAASDHFLVDAQDFNAPIEYEFHPISNGSGGLDRDYHMWYQRAPRNLNVGTPDYNPYGLLYAGIDADGNAYGWEGVSLPFAAELVTTQDKGEITHFYQKRVSSIPYNAGYNSGHEYWLREFQGVADNSATKAADDPTIFTAAMNYPTGVLNAPTKQVTNTFFWDYYYNANGKDANGDDYRHDANNDGNAEQDLSRYYYGQTRTYDEYPLNVPGKPYIAGFPGERYYEFDLSGQFEVLNSGGSLGGAVPGQLDAQTVSFVSTNSFTVAVSDYELREDPLGNVGPGTVTHDGYTFYGNYLNVDAPASSFATYLTVDDYNTAHSTSITQVQFEALTQEQKKVIDADEYNYYVLSDDGSAFNATTTATPVKAFRPFFATNVAERLKAPAARSITFGMGGPTQFEPDEETLDSAASHGLEIYAKKGKIVVESTLETPKHVRITTAAGQVITTFTIQPGERIATPVNEGIYITNLKKLIVE